MMIPRAPHFVGALLLMFIVSSTRPDDTIAQTESHTSANGKYKYTTIKGDLIGVRQYVLQNGLTVFTSVNKTEPRLQTMVAVRTGSQNDPADATGLAHYLEHLLFKGTDDLGTIDWKAEKPLLDEVEKLYEDYRSTKDSATRSRIYRAIDSVSTLAGKFVVSTEMSKVFKVLGARGTNAFTSNDMTVYINDIPANTFSKWVKLEGERYRNPALRNFHTELEVVYEEKNISMDRDGSRMFELRYNTLFPDHTYGTQTTIGTVDHLKNPSIKKIREYFNAYYVPSNMAVILVGDIDPDAAVEEVDKAFSYMRPRPVPALAGYKGTPPSLPVTRELSSKEPPYVVIDFRLPRLETSKLSALQMVSKILYNGQAGLMDLNLVQQQKVISASASTRAMDQATVFTLYGYPREGESLESLKDLLFAELNKVKKGEFSDELLSAVKTNTEIDIMRFVDNNNSRAYALMNTFVTNRSWKEEVQDMMAFRSVTKAQLQAIASELLQNNYGLFYKRQGDPPVAVKIPKPQITPQKVSRDTSSRFVQTLLAQPNSSLSPAFMDFDKDFEKVSTKSGIQVRKVQNKTSELANVRIVFPVGKINDPALSELSDYLGYLGTKDQSPEETKRKLYSLGLDVSFSVEAEKFVVNVECLDSKLDKALSELTRLWSGYVPNEPAFQSLKQDLLKLRSDGKTRRANMLPAMQDYARYGQYNATTNQLSTDQLKKLTSKDVMSLLDKLRRTKPSIDYYGTRKIKEFATLVNASFPKTWSTEQWSSKPYRQVVIDKPRVLFMNWPNMVQAEVTFVGTTHSYDSTISPTIRMFNEYFGGGMSAVVFQEIRDTKALAYSASSALFNPSKPEEKVTLYAYMGTQADKLKEALGAMDAILRKMPKSEKALAAARTAMLNKIESERMNRFDILNTYDAITKLGLSTDQRKVAYQRIPNISFDELAEYQSKYLAKNPFTIVVLGSKDRIDMNELAKYGEVTELTIADVMGN